MTTAIDPVPVPDPVEPPARAALEKTADLVKYLTALGTGALVFSAGLAKGDTAVSSPAGLLIILSWTCLGLSVVGGLMVLARIPIMLSEARYDLNDRYMIIPGRSQHLLFALGVIALGVALVMVLSAHRAVVASSTAPKETARVDVSTVKPQQKYVLVSTPEHRVGKKLPHAHTFLLNERTGETWQMVCLRDGGVQFRRVSVEGLADVR